MTLTREILIYSDAIDAPGHFGAQGREPCPKDLATDITMFGPARRRLEPDLGEAPFVPFRISGQELGASAGREERIGLGANQILESFHRGHRGFKIAILVLKRPIGRRNTGLRIGV